MSRMYTAEVVADSIWNGSRITTVSAIYPHAVHKDMLRHRCMNRNVESFRAQPPEKLIENLRSGHAFKPDVFAKRTKGMGQHSEAITDGEKASLMWDALVENACRVAESYVGMDVAKQQVNFVLQDFCPLTEIITATDWSNFYALRTEVKEDGTPVARPEVYKTAVAIRDAISASTPVERNYHLPLLTDDETGGHESIHHSDVDFLIGISAGRCARWSYGEYRWMDEDRQVGYDRSRRLLRAGHMSPFEQQAFAFSDVRRRSVDRLLAVVGNPVTCPGLPYIERQEIARQLEYSGNLCGWVSARKTFSYEWDYGELLAAAGV